ncbi:translation machinery-associated protein 20 [Moelleriella libera RCEF 2490]|uniref:Translation machinery-associated protein 20 n=1 Tax=Moelleriella libera RCEF 2490 TaxID=1081109 RepID=A0A168EI28_9HYPO|nr:translation machinery-associated protein 20 [Moelleriella libera RCEF 2490]
MPLVIPGITNKASTSSTDAPNSTEEWQNKLVGKKLHDTEHNEINFCKKQLPSEHRVLPPNSFGTTDFNEKRLNIHLNDEGIVTKVNHG